MRMLVLALSTLLCGVAAAQAPAPAPAADFPADARTLTPEQLRERLRGKTFHVALADGTSWRLQYRDAQFFINTSRGFNDDGPWRAEATTLCAEGRRIKPACNEMRLVGETLLMKRDSGEIVKFEPR
jgi:hypothetical protein